MPRTEMTGPTSFFVNNAVGNDAHDGLSSVTAKKTAQALDTALMREWDFCGYNATVYLQGAAVHPGFTIDGRYVGQRGPASLRFIGDEANPDNAIFGTGVSVVNGACVMFSGVRMRTTTGVGFSVDDGGSKLWLRSIWYGDCFGPMPEAANIAGPHARLQFLPPTLNNAHLKLSGNCKTFLNASRGQVQMYAGAHLSFENGATFNTAFALAIEQGLINVDAGIQFTGACSGKKYSSTKNSCIFTGTGNTNFLPGSVSGFTDSSSTYG